MNEVDELLAAMAADTKDRGETNISRLLRKYIEAAEARHAAEYELLRLVSAEAAMASTALADLRATRNRAVTAGTKRIYETLGAVEARQ